ncbi:MAG: SAM-dependent methyltransferase, partial [Acidobacteriaceae bacterium]
MDAFPDGFDLIVIDASFISLRSVIPSVIPFLREAATIVALIKPQFEAGRDRLGKGGVVRDPEVHRMVVREVRGMIADLGLTMTALCASPL